MKQLIVLPTVWIISCFLTYSGVAQQHDVPEPVAEELRRLIGQYSMARESGDSLLLKSILTEDIDQLVSSGEWREGIRQSLAGMQRSSEANQGKRTLEVERIKLLHASVALVDARYTIEPHDGAPVRNMWSSFVTVYSGGRWRIAAIRNMLPSGNP